MKPSGFPLKRLYITWVTAPAIATLVASATLSVIRYSARNTIVEKKSVASLANTSFIVVLSLGASRHCEERSDEAIHWSFLSRRSKRAGRILHADTAHTIS